MKKARWIVKSVRALEQGVARLAVPEWRSTQLVKDLHLAATACADLETAITAPADIVRAPGELSPAPLRDS